MPKVSIIVPVYNVDKYLSKCLSSIITQSFQDFEVLLIDDGSTDNSPEICDSFSRQDKRIKAFHKENGGVSSARNLGIIESKGEWLYFVDSDDELCDDTLSSFNAILDSHDIDIAVGGYKKFDDSGLIWEYQGEDFCKEITKSEMVGQVLKGEYYPIDYVWLAVYRRSIILENNIHFDESIHLHEDNLFFIEYICHTSLPSVLFSKPVYIYYKHDTSVTVVSKSKFDKRWLSIMDAYFRIYKIIVMSFPQDAALIKRGRSSSLWSINDTFENMLRAKRGVFRSICSIAPYKIRAAKLFGSLSVLKYDIHALYTDIKSRV